MHATLTKTLSLILACALATQPVIAAELDPKATETAATINKDKITYGEVDALILQNPQFAMMKAQIESSDERLNQIRTMVLNSMIDKKLLLTAAKSANVISDAEVDKKFNIMLEENGGEAAVKEQLEKRNQEYGAFATEIKDNILISEYINEALGKDIKTSEEDIKAFYDKQPERFSRPAQVRARHILIKTEPDASEADIKAAKDKIDGLHKKATAKDADFANLAKENSQCPSSARGGDLGFFVKEQMVAPFANAAFAMKAGEVSEPVQTKFGYHVIKVEEKKEAQESSYEKAKPVIEKQLEAKAKSTATQNKIKELRAAAKIDISLGPKG